MPGHVPSCSSLPAVRTKGRDVCDGASTPCHDLSDDLRLLLLPSTIRSCCCSPQGDHDAAFQEIINFNSKRSTTGTARKGRTLPSSHPSAHRSSWTCSAASQSTCEVIPLSPTL